VAAAHGPAQLKRAVRSKAWRTARRLGLVPSGQADHLGEDAALLGTTLRHKVIVFFPDPPGSLYQLEQWYPTLREVDDELGVVVVLQDSRTARAVRARSGLDVIVIATTSTLDDLLSRSPVELVLYVNHNPANFTNLRFGQLVHVSLMHGDSDKSVSVSNQLKAYDYAFVAGRAAVDRVAGSVVDYDAAARCLPVGRPQIDELLRELAAQPAGNAGGISRRTVLYAPTWEGPQSTAAYGSVASHGEALVRGLLDAGRFRVIYRPHPLTGVNSPEYRAADARLRELLTEAGAPHRVDVGVPVAASFAPADLLVCDISGIAVDWLATDRPLVITEPADARVWQGSSPLRDAVPALAARDAAGFTAQVDALLTDDAARRSRERLIAYYLGDVEIGAAAKRFVTTCHDVIERRHGARSTDHEKGA
jgi:hypothetical protein